MMSSTISMIITKVKDIICGVTRQKEEKYYRGYSFISSLSSLGHRMIWLILGLYIRENITK